MTPRLSGFLLAPSLLTAALPPQPVLPPAPLPRSSRIEVMAGEAAEDLAPVRELSIVPGLPYPVFSSGGSLPVFLPGFYISVENTRLYPAIGAKSEARIREGTLTYISEVVGTPEQGIWGKLHTGAWVLIRLGRQIYLEPRENPPPLPVPESPAEPGTYKITQMPSTYWHGIGMGYLIQTPEGRVIAIDGGYQVLANGAGETVRGPGTGEENNLRAWLELNAPQGVDAWFLTHMHNDHVRAAASVFRNPRGILVSEVIASPYEKLHHDAKVQDETAEESGFAYNSLKILEEDGRYREGRRGDVLEIDGLRIEILHDKSDDFWRENSNSLVLLLTFGDSGIRMLVLGDLQEEGARRLIERYGSRLRADILQVAHHGNDDLGFLYDIVQPGQILFPVGKGNLFSNPEARRNLMTLRQRYLAEVHPALDRWVTLVIRS